MAVSDWGSMLTPGTRNTVRKAIMSRQAAWISPDGAVHTISQDPDEDGETHLDWALANQDLVAKTGAENPHYDDPRYRGVASEDLDDMYFLNMFNRGWIRQYDAGRFHLNKKYKRALYDFVLMHYPKLTRYHVVYVDPKNAHNFVGEEDVQLQRESLRALTRRLFLETTTTMSVPSGVQVALGHIPSTRKICRCRKCKGACLGRCECKGHKP